ncbi:histidinol phosphatase [bacterium AH-315-E10]|nr:histidinol phosphatase [bacterium AH-315-E10]
MSDHTPTPDNRWDNVRMHMDELPDYIEEIDQARLDFPQLTILKSMECEYADEFHSFYQDELLDALGFDYLVGAAHYVPYNGDWIGVYGGITSADSLKAYSDYVVKSMESGLFAFIAHPDLFACSYLDWDDDAIACSRDILQASQDLDVPLEINGYGLRKKSIDTPAGSRKMYPIITFWELAAEYDIRYVANSDAHRPEDIIANIAEAHSIASRYNLKAADISSLTGIDHLGDLST